MIEPEATTRVIDDIEKASLGTGQPHQQTTVSVPKFVPRPLLLGKSLGTGNTSDSNTDWRQYTKEAEERRRSDALLLEACVHGARVRRGQSVARPGHIITCAQSQNKRHGVVSFIIAPVSPAPVGGGDEAIDAKKLITKVIEEQGQDSITTEASEDEEGSTPAQEDDTMDELLDAAITLAKELETNQGLKFSEVSWQFILHTIY